MKRKKNSETKLYEINENWDFVKYGNITQRKIYGEKAFHISKKTVEKYYRFFIDFVEALNNDFKAKKKAFEDVKLPTDKECQELDDDLKFIDYMDEIIQIQEDYYCEAA